jgi:hypothetical protein
MYVDLLPHKLLDILNFRPKGITALMVQRYVTAVPKLNSSYVQRLAS